MPHLYCCVDVEASGPVPGLYDLVSIGAVAVARREDGTHGVVSPSPFLVEVAPQGGRVDERAMAIHGLTTEHLEREGRELAHALEALDAWIGAHRAHPDQRLVFVGHNAPFDWSYVNHAYHRVDRRNPFGWKALDTKALAMGVLALDWFETNKERLAELLPGLGPEDADRVHEADQDALYQARILIALLDHPSRRPAEAPA